MGDELILHRLGIVENKVNSMDVGLVNLTERVTLAEKEQESINKEIDSIAKHTEAITDMSYEVRNLAKTVGDAIVILKKQEDKIKKQDIKISAIENKPGQLAVRGWIFVLTTIGTAVMGIIIGSIIK